MHEEDPHIHVTTELGTETATRNLLSSSFGLVADRPSFVATGCGRRVGFAMTAHQPEHVTCLPCREYAAGRHGQLAEQLADAAAEAATLPTIALDPADLRKASEHHRDLARRYGFH